MGTRDSDKRECAIFLGKCGLSLGLKLMEMTAVATRFPNTSDWACILMHWSISTRHLHQLSTDISWHPGSWPPLAFTAFLQSSKASRRITSHQDPLSCLASSMFRLSWKHDFIATWSHALHYFGRDAARGCVQWNDHSATPLGQKGVALLKNQWNPMSWDLSQLRPLGLSESLPAVPGGRVEDSDLTTSRWTKAEMWPSNAEK